MQRNRVCTPPASRERSTSPPSHSFAWSACAWTPPLSCAPAWSTSAATTATTAATTTMWHDVDGAAERPLPPPIERRLGLDDDDDDTAPSWLLSSSHALRRSDTMPTLLLHTSSQQQRHDGDGSASEQLQTRTATACCVADVCRDDEDDDDEQVTPRVSCCRASTAASGTQGALQLCTPPPPSTRSSGSSAYTATRLTTTTMTMTGAAVTTTTAATTTTTTTPSCVRNAPLLYTPQVDPARIALRRQLDAEVDATNAQWRAAQQRQQQQSLVSSLSLLHALPLTAASSHAPCRTAADAPPPPPPLSSSPVVVLDGLLYVGARPGVDVALSQLHALRVRHVVNCCAHDCPTTAAVRREFVVHERHAVDRDDYLILHHDYDAVARVVAAAAARGEAVYVHCVAGVNRSVALCVACLMDRRGIGPVEAVCALRRGRPLRLLENVGFRHQLVDHYLQGSAHGGHTNGAAAVAVIAL